MQQMYFESLGKVLKNKARLEKELGVKISVKDREIFVEDSAEHEYLALKVLEAIKLGFSIEKALLLKEDNIILYIINIKELTKRKNLHEIRARIIGTHGKTKNNLENLSECGISIKDNCVGIIGETECMEEAIIALKSMIQGSKQGNVYARLEREGKKRRHRPPEIIKNEFEKNEKIN